MVDLSREFDFIFLARNGHQGRVGHGVARELPIGARQAKIGRGICRVCHGNKFNLCVADNAQLRFPHHAGLVSAMGFAVFDFRDAIALHGYGALVIGYGCDAIGAVKVCKRQSHVYPPFASGEILVYCSATEILGHSHMTAKTILTGVKPTGAPHIGNYIGAIRPALRLADAYDNSYLFIADYHALNAVNDPAAIRHDSYEVAATWLALGLDPNKTVFYRQSDVPEIFELTVLLASVTPKGLMDRSHAYKAAMDKNREAGRDVDADVNMGLYTYPLLMAADILIAQTDIVPVGKDQVQHVEFARDMAGYFNNTYKKPVFKLPEYKLETGNSGAILPGVDGRKMSKSYNNHIPCFIDSAQRQKLVMKIVSDSKRPEEPKNPDENAIFQLYSHFGTEAEVAAMREAFEKGGMGYGDAKKLLAAALERAFEAPTQIYNDYMAHPEKLDDMLAQGAKRAREIARDTINIARETVGLKKTLA